MESKKLKNNFNEVDSDSAVSSGKPYLPVYPSNGFASEYFADDEHSEPDKNKLIFMPKRHQYSKTSNVARRDQNCNILPTSSSSINRNTEVSFACTCNSYNLMQELQNMNLSRVTSQQNTTILNEDTCRLKKRCSKWIENVFIKKYSRHFTKELAFAVDVLMLIRNLNRLPFQYFLYPTINTAPPSPCKEIMDKAFTLICDIFSDDFERGFNAEMNGQYNYKTTQSLLLNKSIVFERMPFDPTEFLIYCVMIGHLATCAEKKGIEKASYFAPLVICRTIYRLKIWEKIETSTFWKDLTEAAECFLRKFL